MYHTASNTRKKIHLLAEDIKRKKQANAIPFPKVKKKTSTSAHPQWKKKGPKQTKNPSHKAERHSNREKK